MSGPETPTNRSHRVSVQRGAVAAAVSIAASGAGAFATIGDDHIHIARVAAGAIDNDDSSDKGAAEWDLWKQFPVVCDCVV